MVRLYGAAEALRDVSGVTLLGRRRASFDQRLAEACGRLGEAAFAAAWAEGSAMTQEQAVAYALEPERPAASAAPGAAGRRPADALTPGEREVAALLAPGLSNRQIAEELVIAEGTAGVHVERILAKLGVHSRHQAADWAVAQGLLDRPGG